MAARLGSRKTGTLTHWRPIVFFSGPLAAVESIVRCMPEYAGFSRGRSHSVQV